MPSSQTMVNGEETSAKHCRKLERERERERERESRGREKRNKVCMTC
jgi:hypothetical protein